MFYTLLFLAILARGLPDTAIVKKAVDAIRRDDGATLTALFLLGLDADASTDLRDKPKLLHIAAEENAVQSTRVLLDEGAKIDAIDGNRELSPLHYAARSHSVQVLQLLIEQGAAVDFVDKFGNTPLHFACWHGSLSAAEILIDSGTSIHAVNNRGTTALHFTTLFDEPEIATVWSLLLLSRGAEVDARDFNGLTSLHSAGRWGACYTAEVLLEAGGAIFARDNAGNTPLHLASGQASACTVRLLLDNGAQPSATNLKGEKPLDIVCTFNVCSGSAIQEIANLLNQG